MSLSYSKSKSKSNSTIFSFSSNNKKKKRCPNGTRKNKKTGECEPKNKNKPNKRCPNGTRKNKKTGICEPKSNKPTSTTNKKRQRRIENNSQKQRSAVKKIQNFMLRTTQKRRLHFLKSVCSDAGVCIAFGQETNKIRNFFGGFTKFRHVTGLKQIGKDSANGFVLEIQYSRDNYNAHSILKNSLAKGSDNLAYEYFVGQYINRKINRFPCFLETYGLFVNNKNKTSLQTNLQQDLTLISDNKSADIYKISCTDSDKLSLLIQHISNAQTIEDKLHDPDFIINDLLFVLYQVYMPLMCLQNEFTHYDLHSENVLLYEPVIGKYIHYHYFVNGDKISFKSKYIAKIIDYGRCFFDDKITNSMFIHNKICQEKSCDPECGEEVGYGWLHEDSLDGYNYYINSSEVNTSHDLRLMYDITLRKNTIPSFALPQFPELRSLLYKVEYGEGIDDQDSKPFGTMPNPDSGIPYKINNVQDAYIMLEALINTSNMQKRNNRDYNNMTKLGDLYVYSEEDKPIRFVPKK